MFLLFSQEITFSEPILVNPDAPELMGSEAGPETYAFANPLDVSMDLGGLDDSHDDDFMAAADMTLPPPPPPLDSGSPPAEDDFNLTLPPPPSSLGKIMLKSRSKYLVESFNSFLKTHMWFERIRLHRLEILFNHKM